MRAANSIHSPLQRRVERKGWTENQFGVLEALFHLGPMNQRMLGEKLLTAGGNISVILDNLEKRGLAKRERGKQDRRSITVHLTAEGEKLIAKIFPRHVEQ